MQRFFEDFISLLVFLWRLFIEILGTIIVVSLVGILVLPFILIIYYPDISEPVSEISKTLIPWTSIILILFVFHQNIRYAFNTIASAIERVRKAGAGNISAEFTPSRMSLGESLDQETIDELNQYLTQVQQERNAEAQWTWHYFLSYIGASIFRSQIELLQSLRAQGPQGLLQLMIYYDSFRQREPKIAENYTLVQYLNYLISNLLIRRTDDGNYEITNPGIVFLTRLENANIQIEQFRG